MFGWLEFVAKMFQQFWQHPDVLARIAVHHDTGRSMPSEELARFEEWRTAYRGTATIFRLSGAYIDLAWSSLTPEQIPRGADARALVEEFDIAALTRAGIYFPEIGHLYPAQWFRHLFAEMGGFGVYLGQYSSYLISDVAAPIAFRRHIEPVLSRHGLGTEVGNTFRELVFRHEEDNLAQAMRRLIGSNASVDLFLADQRLLWPRALAQLGPDATPEWLITPSARPPGTSLAAWWHNLNADEQAAMIEAFPDEVLGMGIDHAQDTIDAATARQQTLREYARQARRPIEPSGPTAPPDDSTDPVRLERRDLDAEDIDILALLADGYSLAEISAQLYLSRSALRSRLDAIQEKLGTHSTIGSVVQARQQGLLRLDEHDPVTASTYRDFSSDEVATLALLAGGLSNTQVAARQRISRSTVTDRLSRIFDKLGVHGRIPAVLAALDRGIIRIASADTRSDNVALPPSTPSDAKSTPDTWTRLTTTARPEMPGEPMPPPPRPGPHRPILGIDRSTGREIEIDPADVRTLTLHNAYGHDDVVFLPSSHDPEDAFVGWAGQPHRDFERIHTAYLLPGEPPNRYAIGTPEAAPWQREVRATGKEPFIVITHATADFYSLQVRVGDGWQEVFVEGDMYARLLTNNASFMNLIAQDEYRPLIIASCSPAQPGSATAQFTAEHLINDGEMDRNIHLAKSVLILAVSGDTSILAVEAMITRSGAHQPLFDSWWGSPWAFEHRPDR